jgi:hypothetical protein
VAINIPKFQDLNTFDEIPLPDPDAKPGHICMPLWLSTCSASLTIVSRLDMDAMGFGMGCACLQTTFTAADLHDARYMYDQFVVLSPVMVIVQESPPCDMLMLFRSSRYRLRHPSSGASLPTRMSVGTQYPPVWTTVPPGSAASLYALSSSSILLAPADMRIPSRSPSTTAL